MIPVAVPLTMTAVFAGLRRCASARAAYNGGFAIYWLGWCLSVPLWLLGPRNVVDLVMTGRRLPPDRLLLLALPIAGAFGTQLIPKRRQINVSTAVTMVGTALINAVGEELLWRGVFMRELDHRPLPAQAWSLIGFSAWHFAPQLILPSPLGRWRFLAGSAAVGLASTAAAWTSGGLRYVVAAHAITDACGVTAARFRLAGDRYQREPLQRRYACDNC
jgi:membrane protease YdiL (CAAX protease family)